MAEVNSVYAFLWNNINKLLSPLSSMSATREPLALVTDTSAEFHDETPTSARDIRTPKHSHASETSSSYFPASPSSSLSSSSSDTEAPVARTNHMIGASYPIPPLERTYAAPTGELDVAAQLAMKPLPRSLHSSLQRAATTTRKPPVEDEETRARKLADAKRELLALAGQI
ncbi:hypothetical protein AAE478_003827 [Parahypoxylon ruwenzoriense]